MASVNLAVFVFKIVNSPILFFDAILVSLLPGPMEKDRRRNPGSDNEYYLDVPPKVNRDGKGDNSNDRPHPPMDMVKKPVNQWTPP